MGGVGGQGGGGGVGMQVKDSADPAAAVANTGHEGCVQILAEFLMLVQDCP